MKNLNEPVKSRGVVLFAFDTPTVNYKRIAELASRLITHNLKLPVTVISDVKNVPMNLRMGFLAGDVWYNSDRYRAYEFSPYEETILLDSDYLTLDDSLLKILETVNDYAVMTNSQTPRQPMSNNMGALSVNSVWATAVVFKRSEKSQRLFELVGRIQRNYSYYRRLYNLREPNFRNDYAFAIADNIINGYTPSQGIPWTMLTIDKPVKNLELKNNSIVVREEDAVHVVPKQSIHIMDKHYLQSNEYNQFVDSVCQS